MLNNILRHITFFNTVLPLLVGLVVTILIAVSLRRVVSTNMVHIVQRRRKTTPYGAGQASGNVYYAWPSWLPYFGVTVSQLPVSNFDLSLEDYEAYDKDRVPFHVHVTAFFRIYDTAKAAQRVSSVADLQNQLMLIVQGAVRKVLASDVIDTIMLERAKFGNQFTEEVKDQLAEWGVESVKSMELMDIRDGDQSEVIHNIMKKKTSHIEMESRVEVAKNRQAGDTAEIEASQTVELRKQEAMEAVGKRTAEKEKEVGISNQLSKQQILEQEKETTNRQMSVRQVSEVRTAEIERDKQVIAAQQEKATTVIIAEAQLARQEKEAAGVLVTGQAKAEAEKLMQLAPVQAQIVLAKEIGENDGYQKYLLGVEGLKTYVIVGSKQAEALQNAEVKIIANAGNPTEGVNSVMDLFTSKGGTNLAGMLEAFAQSPIGKAVVAKAVSQE